MSTSTRGFASLTPEHRREIATKGGKAAQAKGTAHSWKRGDEGSRIAGRKGGLTVSRNLKHMAEIGAKGGKNSRKAQVP